MAHWAFERYEYKSTDVDKKTGAVTTDKGKGINVGWPSTDGAPPHRRRLVPMAELHVFVSGDVPSGYRTRAAVVATAAGSDQTNIAVVQRGVYICGARVR